MTKIKGSHLSKENREVIEAGIRNHVSARTIAKRISVSPSTVTREVRTHRTIREKKLSYKEKASLRCVNYSSCQASGSACGVCSTKLTSCKKCWTRRCIDTCKDYKPKMCSITKSWPYVCPEHCSKRAWCNYPKCHYDAGDAYESYRLILSESRAGICCTQEEIDAMNEIVVPLSKKGQSFEAIWAEHSEKLPVCVRSAYKYQEQGVLGLVSLDMPRKVRLLPRKRPKVTTSRRERIDRTGRTYDDFEKLSLKDKIRVVQADSVEGFNWNKTDILSLHIVSRTFQIYLKKAHGEPKAVVKWLDVIEKALGSAEAFEEIFGILLLDRGIEFDDWEGMERSCLTKGVRRCRVFYCDAQNSNQRSQAERNHEQLRRILPKGRSDFDKLDVWNVAVCCSHVNSYVITRKAGSFRPIEAVADLIPKKLLDELGIARVPADEVTLKPYLMAHAVNL